MGTLPLQVVPTTQEVWEETLQQGMQGRHQDRLEAGIRLDHLVRTSRSLLLADFLGKAHWGRAQGELQGRKQTVRLGMERALRGAVLGLPQVGNALETARGLQDWRGTALELLVDTVLGSQGRGGSHQVLREGLGTVLELQDQKETGTALEHLGRTIHRRSHLLERRAGWGLPGQSRAILDLQQVERGQQEQSGLCSQSSLPGSACRLLRHLPATEEQKET